MVAGRWDLGLTFEWDDIRQIHGISACMFKEAWNKHNAIANNRGGISKLSSPSSGPTEIGIENLVYSFICTPNL